MRPGTPLSTLELPVLTVKSEGNGRWVNMAYGRISRLSFPQNKDQLGRPPPTVFSSVFLKDLYSPQRNHHVSLQAAAKQFLQDRPGEI